MIDKNKQIKAFLDTIAYSEGTKDLGHNDGYDVIVGGTFFSDYSDHPNYLVWLGNLKIYSSAAGRYQILHKYWTVYKDTLKLENFGPASQDKVAIKMLEECSALEDLLDGKFYLAVSKVSSRWASFPGAGYHQHENSIDKLVHVFLEFGGIIVE